MRSAIIAPVRRYFSDRRNVVAVYLYGSQVTKRTSPDSDVDLAILLRKRPKNNAFALQLKFQQDLETLLRRDVDVVILNGADLFLCRQVLTTGTALVVRDPRLAQTMTWSLLKQAWDYLPLKRFFDDLAIHRLARA